MMNYGSWEHAGLGTGIAPSQPTPVPPYPGYTPPPTVTGGGVYTMLSAGQ